MSSERESVNAVMLADAPYLGQRLASRMPAGVLSLHDEIEGNYSGVPLCVDHGNGQPIMIIGLVNLCYRVTKYQSGTAAVQSLQEVIGPNQAGDFMGIMDPVYYHDLELLEYHGPSGTPQPQETPALQPDAPYATMKGRIENPTGPHKWYKWSKSEAKAWLKENVDSAKTGAEDLPNFYAFRQHEPGDAQFRIKWVGPKTAPSEGTEDAGRPIMLVLFTSGDKKGQVQSYKFYHGTEDLAKKTAKSVDLTSLPTELLNAMFTGLEERYESGLTTADLPPDQMREHGREIFGELKKRVPHIKMESPLLEDPKPVTKPYISRIVKSQDSSLGNPEYMYVLSLVLEPNDGKDGAKAEPDFDNEIYDRHAIRKMAFRYVRKSRGIGIMHEGERLDDDIARVVQSFVIEDGWELTTDQGRALKQGAWLLGAEVKRASPLGKAIASGELRAFSIDGLALKKPEKMAA